MEFGLNVASINSLRFGPNDELQAFLRAARIKTYEHRATWLETNFPKNPGKMHSHCIRMMRQLRGDDPFAGNEQSIAETEKAMRELEPRRKRKKKRNPNRPTPQKFLVYSKKSGVAASVKDGKRTNNDSKARRRPV